jgi:multidrug resistance protein, MATE family
MELGIVGAAMALNITYGLNYILQELYISYFLHD